jgi:hypothetical protein
LPCFFLTLAREAHIAHQRPVPGSLWETLQAVESFGGDFEDQVAMLRRTATFSSPLPPFIVPSALMGLFRKRDVAVVLLISISIYLSYFESPRLTYSIDPAWFIDQNAEIGSHGRLVDYNIVRPIVTDLEGDGVNEVIMITNDMWLKVRCPNPSVAEALW